MFIHMYSREDAVEDGVLAFLSEFFPKLFLEPTYCTSAFFDSYISDDFDSKDYKIGSNSGERVLKIYELSIRFFAITKQTKRPYYFDIPKIDGTFDKAQIVHDGEVFTYMMINED
ncbi:hypothetical protein [Silvanigrella sp.]|jgi:hypothetical protein|uniref:hypothetical protein n=1 Tax=Silvanigrella sp. TaxID=2024976 RepID=UPI0037C86088|nr:hypothetical protein [Silvanigrellaceae bacterium]